ncbi:MAG: hypothetical protein DPW20_16910 [Candidatus Brocadia sp.]|nr:hypothetical protein [Candidatus Brocadia sp.]
MIKRLLMPFWAHGNGILMCNFRRGLMCDFTTTGEQRLYVGGLLVDTKFHPAGNTIVPSTSYADMRIGYSRVNNGYFNGKIDEVRLYNKPLSDQEVQDLYNSIGY